MCGDSSWQLTTASVDRSDIVDHMLEEPFKLVVRERQVGGMPPLRVTVEVKGRYIGTLEFNNHCEMKEIAEALLRETISD